MPISGASIRLTVWKSSGESRYPEAFPPVLENFRRAFSRLTAPLNLTSYGGRGHKTTNFPFSFWNWIKSLRIQLQEKSPALGILSGSKLDATKCERTQIHFLLAFSLPSLLTLDCSRIAKEIAIVSGFFVEGGRQMLLYSCKWQEWERS